MLQNIRDNVQGTMAKVIIAIIIVPFAVFGIDSLFGGGQTTVAKVNGESIGEANLQRAVELRRRQVVNAMGEQFDPAMLEDSRLRGEALENLIGQTLLTQAAEAGGMRVPSSLLDQLITSMPQFQQDGKFSPDLYLSLLRSEGIPPSLFKELLSIDILVGQMNAGLSTSEFATSADMALLAKLVAQQRSFRYLTIPRATVEVSDTVAEDELQAYYDEHIDEYRLPEQVKLAYISLRQEDFFQPVDEAVVRVEYESERKGYQAQTERRLAHILLELDGKNRDAVMAEAQALKIRLESGEDFASLASEYSADIGSASSGGDLGFSDGSVFPEAFEAAAAKLVEGGISAPVETDAGIHLIKVVEVRGSEPPSFEERRAAITARIQTQQSEPRFLAVIEELRDLAFNAETLDQPAKALDLTVQESGWVSADAGDGLFADHRLRAAAFSEDVKQAGHNSEVVELAPDHFVILRVLEQQPARPEALADIREVLIQRILEERAQTQIMAKAEALRDELAAGAEMADIATRDGLSWQLADAVKRQTLSVPMEISAGAFSIPENATAASIVTLSDGGVALIALDKVIDGTVSALSQQERNAIAAQFQRLQGTIMLAAFNESVREKADVDVLVK